MKLMEVKAFQGHRHEVVVMLTWASRPDYQHPDTRFRFRTYFLDLEAEAQPINERRLENLSARIFRLALRRQVEVRPYLAGIGWSAIRPPSIGGPACA